MRIRTSRFVWILAAAAAVAAAAAAWHCGPGGRPSTGSRLRVLFTGETMGELEPCNCSGKMAGGLPARGGYLKSMTEDYLLVDTGCVGNGARDFERLRGEAAFRAMLQMRYDAVNVGEHELWLGRDELSRLSRMGVPLVSANVLDESGAPAAWRYVLLRRAGLSVAVTGLVESAGNGDRHLSGVTVPVTVSPGLRVMPPREALARLIPELRRKAGVIIVLADLDLESSRALAREFPEVTAILFRGRRDSHAPELVNRTVVASVYGQARYVGDLTLTWETARRVTGTGKAVLLDERSAPSLAVIAAGIQWYKDAIAGRTFDLSQGGPAGEGVRWQLPEGNNRFVGSETCRACHPYQYERWKAQRHSRAMESLKKAGYDWSPECIVCHVVGYGSPDGYQSMEKTPELGRVGCENCHGRGAILRHGGCKGLARRPNEQTCRQCHTMVKHETFNFDEKWKIIQHKEKK